MFDTQVDFAKTGLKNAYSQSYKDNESSFLAGVTAAKFTTGGYGNTNDKKIIGFIAGVEIPIINDFLVGFIEGAKYADPEVKVLISYIGSFHDSAKGKEMALAQYQQGADVIFQVAGGSGLGVLNAAQESGKYAIGVDIDQYNLYKTSNPAMANQIITSAVKKVDVAVAAAIKRAVNNELPWGTHEFLGIAEGANGIAKNENYEKCVSQEARDFIDVTEKKVLSGEIKIKSAYGMPQEELNSLRDSVKP
jgi:basic membrane protein A